MVIPKWSFLIVTFVIYTSSLPTDDYSTEILKQVTQEQAEAIMRAESIARDYLIPIMTELRNMLLPLNGYRTILENIIRGLQTRSLDPLRMVKDRSFFASETSAPTIQQLAKVVYNMQGCSEATDYSLSQWQTVLEAVPEFKYNSTPVPRLNIGDAERNIIDRLDRPFVQFALVAIHLNYLTVRKILLQSILESFPFEPYTPDLGPIVRNLNQRLATASFPDFRLGQSASGAVPNSAVTLKRILSEVLTRENLEPQIAYQVNQLLLSLREEPGNPNGEDVQVAEWLMSMRPDDYPLDVLAARDELAQLLRKNNVQGINLGSLPSEMAGYPPTARLLGLLARLLSLEVSDPAAIKAHALYSHVKLRYLANLDEYFTPRSAADVALLLNAFLTNRNQANPGLMQQINEIFASGNFDWSAMFRGFNFSRYSRPRPLLMDMLKHILHSPTLPACHIISIEYFLEHNREEGCFPKADKFLEIRHEKVQPLIALTDVSETNSSSVEGTAVEQPNKICQDGRPTKMIDPESIVEIIDAKQHAGFIIDLIRYNPIPADKYSQPTRYLVFHSVLGNLKTNKYKDDVSDFVISQAILRLPLNQKANDPPTYIYLCPEEITALEVQAPTTQAPIVSTSTTSAIAVTTPSSCANMTVTIDRDSLRDVIDPAANSKVIMDLLYADLVLYEDYRSQSTRADVLRAVLEKRRKQINQAEIGREITQFLMSWPITADGQLPPSVVYTCLEMYKAGEVSTCGSESSQVQGVSCTSITPTFSDSSTETHTSNITHTVNTQQTDIDTGATITQTAAAASVETEPQPDSELCSRNETLIPIIDSNSLLEALGPQAPKARFIRNRVRSYVIPVSLEFNHTSAEVLRDVLDAIKEEVNDPRIVRNVNILKTMIADDGPGREPPKTLYACLPRGTAAVKFSSHFSIGDCRENTCSSNKTITSVINTYSLFDALRAGAPNRPNVADLVRAYIMPIDATQNYRKGDVLLDVLNDLLANVNDTMLVADIRAMIGDIMKDGPANERPEVVAVCFPTEYLGALGRSIDTQELCRLSQEHLQSISVENNLREHSTDLPAVTPLSDPPVAVSFSSDHSQSATPASEYSKTSTVVLLLESSTDKSDLNKTLLYHHTKTTIPQNESSVNMTAASSNFGETNTTNTIFSSAAAPNPSFQVHQPSPQPVVKASTLQPPTIYTLPHKSQQTPSAVDLSPSSPLPSVAGIFDSSVQPPASFPAFSSPSPPTAARPAFAMALPSQSMGNLFSSLSMGSATSPVAVNSGSSGMSVAAVAGQQGTIFSTSPNFRPVTVQTSGSPAVAVASPGSSASAVSSSPGTSPVFALASPGSPAVAAASPGSSASAAASSPGASPMVAVSSPGSPAVAITVPSHPAAAVVSSPAPPAPPSQPDLPKPKPDINIITPDKPKHPITTPIPPTTPIQIEAETHRPITIIQIPSNTDPNSSSSVPVQVFVVTSPSAPASTPEPQNPTDNPTTTSTTEAPISNSTETASSTTPSTSTSEPTSESSTTEATTSSTSSSSTFESTSELSTTEAFSSAASSSTTSESTSVSSTTENVSSAASSSSTTESTSEMSTTESVSSSASPSTTSESTSESSTTEKLDTGASLNSTTESMSESSTTEDVSSSVSSSSTSESTSESTTTESATTTTEGSAEGRINADESEDSGNSTPGTIYRLASKSPSFFGVFSSPRPQTIRVPHEDNVNFSGSVHSTSSMPVPPYSAANISPSVQSPSLKPLDSQSPISMPAVAVLSLSQPVSPGTPPPPSLHPVTFPSSGVFSSPGPSLVPSFTPIVGNSGTADSSSITSNNQPKPPIVSQILKASTVLPSSPAPTSQPVLLYHPASYTTDKSPGINPPVAFTIPPKVFIPHASFAVSSLSSSPPTLPNAGSSGNANSVPTTTISEPIVRTTSIADSISVEKVIQLTTLPVPVDEVFSGEEKFTVSPGSLQEAGATVSAEQHLGTELEDANGKRQAVEESKNVHGLAVQRDGDEGKLIRETTEIYFDSTETPEIANIVMREPSGPGSSIAYMHPPGNTSLPGYHEFLRWPVVLKPQTNHTCYDGRSGLATSPVLVLNITNLFEILRPSQASELDEYLTATYLTSIDTYYKLADFDFERFRHKEDFLRNVLQFLLQSEDRADIVAPMKRILSYVPETASPLQLGALCNHRIFQELPKRNTQGALLFRYVSDKKCSNGVLAYEVRVATDVEPSKETADALERFSRIATREKLFENVVWEGITTQRELAEILTEGLSKTKNLTPEENAVTSAYLKREMECERWKMARPSLRKECKSGMTE